MCLDSQRLGKQRVECRQIQRALQQPGIAWARHPATRMWDGHILALMLYGDCMIREWVRRGFQNNMPLMLARGPADMVRIPEGLTMPRWIGDEEFHSRHRSMLLMKDPDHYGKNGWTEKPGLGYIWPLVDTDKERDIARVHPIHGSFFTI